MEIKIKKLHPDAKLPSYAHDGDAGFDFCAIESLVVSASLRVVVGTGIAIEIPLGFVGLVWDKSGISTKHGIKTLAGVIDAGYNGEIKIGLINLGSEDYKINKGDKIAQMLIQKVEHAEIKEVNELSDTTRGNGGFGSTGK